MTDSKKEKCSREKKKSLKYGKKKGTETEKGLEECSWLWEKNKKLRSRGERASDEKRSWKMSPRERREGRGDSLETEQGRRAQFIQGYK